MDSREQYDHGEEERADRVSQFPAGELKYGYDYYEFRSRRKVKNELKIIP